MQYIINTWDNNLIRFQRDMFYEAKGAKDFEQCFKRYLKRIKKGKRAMLLCVCRGKLSEGIDFIDNAARAIFVIGIPYPCVNDPRVVQKQEYLDLKRQEEGENFEIDGQKWYKLQASRTVNQAIGRVIRHIKDYGAIFLCDERYGGSSIEISKWMKDRKRIWDKRNIERLEGEVKHFIEGNQRRFEEEAKIEAKKVKKLAKKKRKASKSKNRGEQSDSQSTNAMSHNVNDSARISLVDGSNN